MFACGIPIFFQEVAAGQYLGAGGLTMVGQFVPILQGEELFIFGDTKNSPRVAIFEAENTIPILH